MHHARTDIGPTGGLMLLRKDHIAILELAADGFLESVEVEPSLGAEALVEKAADLEELVDRLIDLLFAAIFGERIDDQGVELGVLRLLHPVMLHQALEERIKVTVVPDRSEIMLLGHPLDHQDDEADRERIVAKHFGADRFRRPDHLALDREAPDESFVEPLKEVDVLRLLAREVEDCADPPVVAEQMR